jgi:riboflavin synthase alpha subunit
MFTGLIESVGRVSRIESMPGGVRLHVASPLSSDAKVGDSLAHNGVCLTVVEAGENGIVTEVSPETLRVTSLGGLEPGSLVNLERPVRPDAPMGGHFVQGHVDATGRVQAIVHEGDFWRFTFTYPQALAAYFIPKGSIAVDGISLTVAALRGDAFDVQIIPHTWEQTNLQGARVGDLVNLECDMLGKYVVRVAELMLAARNAAGETAR